MSPTPTASRGSTFWTEVVKAADESVTSSTVNHNDAELFFAAVSGAQYEFELFLIYASPVGGTVPDLKFDLGEDGTTRGWGVLQVGWSQGDLAGGGVYPACNQSAPVSLGTDTANRCAYLQGVYVGGGGTFRVRWAQINSNVNAVTVRAGSVLRYRRIA
jgi:hypothetical protein